MLERSGAWAWGYSELDHYVGYVRSDALIEPYASSHIVTARSALVFEQPTSRAAVLADLPLGSRVSGTVENGFLRTSSGYVAIQHLAPVADVIADPVAVAERLIGTPYLWGGRGIGGIDCSGLVQIAFGMAGIALPRDSDQQMTVGTEAAGPLRRGDLLFYEDHVIIMADSDRAIHASGYWMSTAAEPLADIAARLGEPRACRRVLP